MKVKLTKSNNGKQAGETVTVSDVEGQWLVANDYAETVAEAEQKPAEKKSPAPKK